MVKEVDLLSYWMPILRNLREFKEIAYTEEQELKHILEAVDLALSNMFIETADEYGIARFEKMMGIFPEDGATLDTRRFAVQVKWSDSIPYTEETIRNQLSVLCGDDGYALKIDYPKYRLFVKLSLTNEDNVEVVETFLDRVVPANMVIMVTLFNTHTTLSDFTYEQLGAYTHKEVREDILSVKEEGISPAYTAILGAGVVGAMILGAN